MRSLAGGNETVPTVTVAERALVNPSAGQVLDAVGQVAPELVPVRARQVVARSRWLRRVQWVVVLALLVASVVAEAGGVIGLSWWLDSAAVLILTLGWVLRKAWSDSSRPGGGQQRLTGWR